MHKKHICLLGFSKQAESIIKRQIVEQCKDLDFVWVSASAKNLDGVIINAMFLATPQIQRYIEAVAPPCAAVYTQANARSIADGYNIPAIELKDKMVFNQQWLDALLQSGSSSIQPKAQQPQSQTENENVRSGLNYQELINLIKNRSTVCIKAIADDKTVFLIPAEQAAFINFARNEIPGVEVWHWKTLQEVPESDLSSMRRINIDQWLFETIWQSQIGVFNIDPQMFYKLIRWPQPFSQHKRSEALRLAAQIKFHPVKISDLVEKTQFSRQLIEHFLFASKQAGQIETVQPTKEVLQQEQNQKVPKNDPDREIKRSFIGRLRAKLKI